jgi:ferritin-like metal-binding protein YciE
MGTTKEATVYWKVLNQELLGMQVLSSSQKIEHYEIATYGTLSALLGKNDAAKLLTQTLAEEKEADCLLSDVALNIVNSVAAE